MGEDKIFASDATKIVITPSRTPATSKDQKRLNSAVNRNIRAQGEAAYSIFRFIPRIKYLTDFGDVLGINPASYNKPNEYDLTDGMSLGGNLMEPGFNNIAKEYAKPGTTTITVGRRPKTKHKTIIKTGPDSFNYKFAKYANKYNPLKMIGFVGDIYQGVRAAKELYDANANLVNTEKSIDWKIQPYSIDTSLGMKVNERKNAKYNTALLK